MAAQDFDEPGRFDRIDGKRIFDYMQFIGSPRVETKLYYSANTIKLHLTMVNRLKARQEAARGVPEPSTDELHWSKTTLKVLNQLYKPGRLSVALLMILAHSCTFDSDPDNDVLKTTPAEHGIYTLKDH
ncbi:BQ5605_C034g11331 [Microbotryum silenes-dioicae]|uniref:BQ5605_C034g11331 protein n=1 Tax=Microbotryum silenes-dioicae TaxID=796604 RepID=A0A2X0MGM9_9BASI|nr:BQ5605_C034g11331 [Microbotryum silenes-dioicae]